MFTICKKFEFSAAHHLNGLAPDHPCARVHGHNYVVEVRVDADELDELGMVFDFKDFDSLGHFIALNFDHKDINTVIQQPTSENIAKYLGQMASALLGTHHRLTVRVSETPKTWAEWRR